MGNGASDQPADNSQQPTASLSKWSTPWLPWHKTEQARASTVKPKAGLRERKQENGRASYLFVTAQATKECGELQGSPMDATAVSSPLVHRVGPKRLTPWLSLKDGEFPLSTASFCLALQVFARLEDFIVETAPPLSPYSNSGMRQTERSRLGSKASAEHDFAARGRQAAQRKPPQSASRGARHSNTQ